MIHPSEQVAAHPDASAPHPSLPIPVCVAITAYPVAGGMRSVLAEVSRVMADNWHLSFLTRQRGADAHTSAILTFGRGPATYWHFPNVWLYVWAGWRALRRLLRRGAAYQVILPQDGLYTGAFAALVGRIAGIRVVIMDHGTITLPFSAVFRAERLRDQVGRAWPRRLLARMRFALYQTSLRVLAMLAAAYADHFLIAGDEVEQVYRQRFGVPASRITRYPYVVDVARFPQHDEAARARLRAHHGFAPDAIIVALINRLAPEKGMSVALDGIARALAAVAPADRERVRVLVAGDGPLRQEVESTVRQLGLRERCVLWGEATPADVVTILGMSDIFLYTGLRGTNFSMAVLEAMAAGCAVVASVEPRSNATLLADGRGIAVPAGDLAAVGAALARLLGDARLRRAMGQLARDYVSRQHSDAALRAALLRATRPAGLSVTVGAPAISAHQSLQDQA